MYIFNWTVSYDVPPKVQEVPLLHAQKSHSHSCAQERLTRSIEEEIGDSANEVNTASIGLDTTAVYVYHKRRLIGIGLIIKIGD